MGPLPDPAAEADRLGTALLQRGDPELVQQALTALMEAVQATPKTHRAYPGRANRLAEAYRRLFRITGNLEALEIAINIWEDALEHAAPESPYRAGLHNNLGKGLAEAFRFHPRREVIDAALAHIHQAELLATGAEMRAIAANSLAALLKMRFDAFGETADRDHAIRIWRAELDHHAIGSVEWAIRATNLAAALNKAGQHQEAAVHAANVLQQPDTGEHARAHKELAAAGGADARSHWLRACQTGTPELAMEAGRDWARHEAARECWPEAAQAAGFALEAVERAYAAQLGAEASEGTWLEAARGVHREAAYARFRIGGHAGAVEALEQGRARMLAESLLAGEVARPTWADVRAAAQAHPDTAFAYLATASKGGLAAIVVQDSVHAVPLDIDDDGLRQLLCSTGYLDAQFGLRPMDAALDAVLPELRRLVAAPVAAALPANRACVLIPCGWMALAPLGAAGLSDVRYAPSVRVWAECAARLATPAEARLTAVGNPTPTTAPELPFAAAEVEEIANAFHGAKTTLIGDDASAAAVRAALRATYVHLSCHGTFNPVRPERSCLLLGGGPLTLGELVDERGLTGTRLVTLSACQSAIVDFNKLPDEVVGFPSGFLRAGAAAVIGSLWPVDDFATMLLMVRFHELMPEAESPAAAFEAARAWLRTVTNAALSQRFAAYRRNAPDAPAGVRMAYALARKKFTEFTVTRPDPAEQPFAHPCFWAPFVYYGA